MENQVKQDVKISGSGSTGGGKYDEVSISGSGKINGDLECNSFSSSGSSKVIGNIKTEFLKISGSGRVEGNVEANEMTVSGSSHILGDMKTKFIRISGSTHIEGTLHSEEVKISGSVHIGKDCEAENFKASGGFRIEGLLNAGNIDVNLGGQCNAKEIGGEKINVRRGRDHSFFQKILSNMFSQGGYMTAEVIEGDEIYLEYTTAKMVRGGNITMGEGCTIDVVEYRNELKAVPSTNIGERKQI